ncbi:MAG: hypothetical protein J4F35_00835 [Candidatus Latescibacteria bacterium]|nr:hypothetical protein [Candidatus Latescibacterota bacterium]
MKATLCVRGARAGGLANVDMDLPLGRIVCFTGRSGSGRRAMALDILYAESRRHYMQALSPAERESVSGTARADVDEISGLPPAIYLGAPRRGRTVGDYLQLDGILAQIMLEEGQMHCLGSYAADEVEREVARVHPDTRCLVLAPLALRNEGMWQQLVQAGFTRVAIDGQIQRIEGDGPALPSGESEVHVVVDRLVPDPSASVRFLEAVRVSRSISSGQTVVWVDGTSEMIHLNQQPTCGECGRQYEPLATTDFGAGQPLAGQVTLHGRTMDELMDAPLGSLREWLAADSQYAKVEAALAEACGLELGHLPLSRRLESLAAGEWQRLQLAACLSSGLTGILYILEGLGSQLSGGMLDEVAAGLRRLVAGGNTALLLDHTPELLVVADEVWAFAGGRVQAGETAEIERDEAGEKWVAEQVKPALAIRGDGVVGPLAIELPHGKLTCVCGPSGSGKTRLLHEVLLPLLKGRSVEYATAGVPRNSRVVMVEPPSGKATVLAGLGLFEHVADLYAASPAATARGWDRDTFLLDRPGGRCPSCEGRGQCYFDLEFLEDIAMVCAACEGRRYRDETCEVTLRGASIADVLGMTLEQACAHFARYDPIRPRLEAAVGCGLGYLLLGQEMQGLEWGEWLRLRLALESTRASRRTWVLIDDPASGDHPEDVRAIVAALRGLVDRGATVVVADQHPTVKVAADWVVDLAC